VLGRFLEVTATLLLVLPILAPALRPMVVDPVHLSMIFTHNMEMGLVHPPVGLNLFVLSSIATAPMGTVIRGILPFLVIRFVASGRHNLRADPQPGSRTSCSPNEGTQEREDGRGRRMEKPDQYQIAYRPGGI